MPSKLGSALILAALMIAACTLIEVIAGRDRVPTRSRLFGGLLHGVQITLSAALAYPLSLLINRAGIGPILPPVQTWAGWFAIPLALLYYDLLRYWEHRFEHRFFWRVHAIHHSVREISALNAWGHPLQAIPMMMLITLPFSLLNFDGAGVPLAVGALEAFLIYFIHSPVDAGFGPVRHVIVTHNYHRIHHSLEPAHFDKNFAIIFPIWDRLFGTKFDPKDEWPDVGIGDVPQPRTLRAYLTQPFIRRGCS